MGNTERLQQVKQVGISLAIDDFGTGYSSLSYLKRFPIDKLKIDRSFVSDLVDNHTDAEIVKAIIALGRSLGLRVIAEGVEDAVQLQKLQALGANEYQGYLYQPPVPATVIEQLLFNERVTAE